MLHTQRLRVAGEEPLHSVRSRWPLYEEDEIAAVTRVLRSGLVNALLHGDETRSFEREFAEYVDMPHALCVANGTVSLELALRAFRIGPGDEVVVPARSFFATAACVSSVGATPVFADVDPASQNIDPASVERLLSSRTRAIICVHLAGWPCDMAALQAICRKNDLFLIEDCAQAHGAALHGRKVGAFGDAGSFSFCTDKIMSTGGEGGLLTFASPIPWRRAWSYKDHGKDFAAHSQSNGLPGQFRYVHDSAGSNLRMTEMQAAIGRIQLRKLPHWLARRRANAARLTEALAGEDELLLPAPPSGVEHAFYKYYVQLATSPAQVEARRSRIIVRLQELGIACSSGSCPDMSLEGAYAGVNVTRDGDLPQARALGLRTIMLQVDHTLSADNMERTGDALIQALRR